MYTIYKLNTLFQPLPQKYIASCNAHSNPLCKMHNVLIITHIVNCHASISCEINCENHINCKPTFFKVFYYAIFENITPYPVYFNYKPPLKIKIKK